MLRRTRLAVFEGTPESLTDYWLEDMLPLVGLDMDPHGKDGPQVEIIARTNARRQIRSHDACG
jgi:hypothetical protein